MCEIDVAVCEAGKKYFPDTLSVAFNDPRLNLMINDAAAYLRNDCVGKNYDVIICDSSDPVGPAEILFEAEFFINMKQALTNSWSPDQARSGPVMASFRKIQKELNAFFD